MTVFCFKGIVDLLVFFEVMFVVLGEFINLIIII